MFIQNFHLFCDNIILGNSLHLLGFFKFCSFSTTFNKYCIFVPMLCQLYKSLTMEWVLCYWPSFSAGSFWRAIADVFWAIHLVFPIFCTSSFTCKEPICHFKVNYLCLLAFLRSATLNCCVGISVTPLCWSFCSFSSLISDHAACLLFYKCPGGKEGNCSLILPSSPQSLHI